MPIITILLDIGHVRHFPRHQSSIATPKQEQLIPGIFFAEVLHADDTLVFGNHTPSINKLLKAIEEESWYCNMELNYDKCISFTTNWRTSSIKFKDGSTLPRKNKTVYLRSFETDTLDNAAEVSNRIATAMKTAKQLMIFWDKANTTTEWKWQVFNAVIQCENRFSFETMQLTKCKRMKRSGTKFLNIDSK